MHPPAVNVLGFALVFTVSRPSCRDTIWILLALCASIGCGSSCDHGEGAQFVGQSADALWNTVRTDAFRCLPYLERLTVDCWRSELLWRICLNRVSWLNSLHWRPICAARTRENISGGIFFTWSDDSKLRSNVIRRTLLTRSGGLRWQLSVAVLLGRSWSTAVFLSWLREVRLGGGLWALSLRHYKVHKIPAQ